MKMVILKRVFIVNTGKSKSEALIFVSINPQYDNRLFIKLQVQYKETTSLDHGQNMYRTCSAHVLPMFYTCGG